MGTVKAVAIPVDIPTGAAERTIDAPPSAERLTGLGPSSRYTRERVVFGRSIGKNQANQHPLAECWLNLEAALSMSCRAAQLHDAGHPCAAEANGAKFRGARAGHAACLQAVLTHGGMGYAKEYHVDRLMREVLIASDP